jgi:lipopolysaccharide export system permease protein
VTRIDRYLLAVGLPPFLFGLLLYSGLAVVSVTLPRVQWIVGTPVLELLLWLALQLPSAMVQTLPIALVLGVLIAFGQLASQNELLALQAGGLSLRRVVAVFLLLATLATATGLALNEWVLPGTHTRVANLYWQLTTERNGLFRLAQQNVPIGDFSLTFRSSPRRDPVMLDVRIQRWEGERLNLVLAERGWFDGPDLILEDYRIVALDLAALDAGGDPGEVLAGLVPLLNRPADPQQRLTITTSVTAEELIARFGRGGFEDPRSISDTYADARDPDLDAASRLKATVLLHRRLAEPFANLTLLLIALPLSILYARSRSVAFGLSLVVTLVWYLLLTMGQLFSQNGALPPAVGPWLGNAVLGALGVVLLLGRLRYR